MIHRQNYLDVRDYLHHIDRVRQNDPETVKRARGHLRHLLEWADDAPLPRARLIDPTFPAYLLTARCDGKERTLAPASIAKGLSTARQFFDFARLEWTHRYKPITASWIESLQPPRGMRADSRLPVRQIWTLEHALQVAGVSVETLRQERGKVAVCMLFLSGMRADALASLPLACVDLPNRTLYQLPEQGVRTKNRKAAKTYLLDIPELITVLESWHARLLAADFSPNILWYSNLTRDGMTLLPTTVAVSKRYNVIEDDLRLICERAGVPYRSPHTARHGHTVYALKRAQNVAQLKAISQNIMHKSLVTTDTIYGRLVNDDVQEIIASL